MASDALPIKCFISSSPTPAALPSSALSGQGGIGLILSEQIRTLELQQMAFVILMILLTVSVIDYFCSKIRFAIIGKSAL